MAKQRESMTPPSTPPIVKSLPPMPPAMAGGSSGDVEVHDGTRAMEVQTIFRDVVIGTRHLSNPTGKSTHGQGTVMLFGGIGLAAIALITFVITAVSVGAEKAAYEAWQAAGKESKAFQWQSRSAGADVMLFGGLILGFSLAYSLSTAVFGGFTPAISTWLIEVTGDKAAPAYWLSVAAVCGLGATLALYRKGRKAAVA